MSNNLQVLESGLWHRPWGHQEKHLLSGEPHFFFKCKMEIQPSLPWNCENKAWQCSGWHDKTLGYKGESTVIQRYLVNGQVCDPGLTRARWAPAPGEGEASVHAPALTGHSTTSSLSFLACKMERTRLITNSYVKCEDTQICAWHTGKCKRAKQRLFLLFSPRNAKTFGRLHHFWIPSGLGAWEDALGLPGTRPNHNLPSTGPLLQPEAGQSTHTDKDTGDSPRCRRAAFCTPGQTRPMGRGLPRLGLVGCQARLARINTAGVARSRRERQQGEQGLQRGQSARCGRGGGGGEAEHTLPHMPLHWAGRTRGFGGRSAGPHSPPHGSPGRQGPTAPTATPGSLRPDRACPAAPPARGPGSPSSPLLASAEPGEEASPGRTLRKAWVTWGVAGGWAAFRAGGGASGRGRRVRAQPKRAGAVGPGPGR